MDSVERDIRRGNYSLFQRILYGGLSSGAITIPSHLFTLLITIIFPPLGAIFNSIGEYLADEFPFITWEAIKAIFDYNNLTTIIYTWILTSLFYLPGLIYILSKISPATKGVNGTYKCDPKTGQCELVLSNNNTNTDNT